MDCLQRVGIAVAADGHELDQAGRPSVWLLGAVLALQPDHVSATLAFRGEQGKLA
ncbi:hypothetical protein [Parasphingorhabdus pacifica]